MALLMLPGCGSSSGEVPKAQKPVVNFYNWFDYIDDETLPAFEAETGIKVRLDVYDSNEMLEAKLMAGHSGYDLVVPATGWFATERRAGLFQPLDKSKLSNYGNLDPLIMAKLAEDDPGNRYSVPYAWGMVGMGINVEAVKKRIPDAPLDSLALLFDPDNARRLADCGITLLNAPQDVSETALLYLGLPPNSLDPGDLKKAMNLVAGIRPYVRYFNSAQYIDDLGNGEICLALGWTGDFYVAMRGSPIRSKLRAVVPKEGAIVWVDHLAIPADAPHPENAMALINYLMRPEVAARITNTVHFANANRASTELVDPEIRNDPAIYPPRRVLEEMQPIGAVSNEYQRLRNRLWERVKSGN